MTQSVKQCSKCRQSKGLECFSKSPKNKDGLQYQCKQCAKEYRQQWAKTINPGRDAEYRANRSEHYKKLRQEYAPRKYYYDIAYRYGISPEKFEELWQSQGGSCGICGLQFAEKPTRKLDRANIDHCHETGTVRGLLCLKCNTGLGALGDNQEGVRKALSYLEAS